jgi:hypothetical protein
MTTIPIGERVARLAAKLNSDEADELLRSWSFHRQSHGDDELEQLYADFVSRRFCELSSQPDNDAPIEEKIDAMIDALTADPANEDEKRSGEQLQETWGKARELIVNHQFNLAMLARGRRMARGDGDA